MLNIGDYVLSQKTGHIGKVIGYGHEIIGNTYTSTIKVLVEHTPDFSKKGLVEEDVYSAWTAWQGANNSKLMS
ncbi:MULTISPECIES: hypothetical protein [Cyanophyceae]|uniref:hypothetical protein n=1 Tax=Cyanophyceae TaxID=3028117 RepID=UPI001686F33B|nr:hypothetical protein [Trichocoleus sp. FACHB-40]MBD2006836.1 hypothetical protein [Trichocoleus sp. FACHB-40]